MLNNIRIQPPDVRKLSPKLAVFGVGGAGTNAVNNMIESNLEGVEFCVANTDSQSLDGSHCPNKIQLGEDVTGGLGAGSRPEIGRAAAEESIEEVMSFLDGANMVFITAGMGGGTGTGAAPIIAKACREQGVLTVGVVTKPFHFEGTQRMRMAEEGIEQMQQYVDTLIVIPNQNLFRVANEKTTFSEAFKMADSVLQSGVRGVTDLMVMEGLVNLDFADVRSSMMDQGKAMLGTGEATGERRSIEAAEAAINNPLLDDVSMKGAKGVIINITGGYDMTLFEADEACNRIRDEIDPEANIIFGSTFDESLEGKIRVSVIATGIDQANKAKKPTNFDLNKSPIAQTKPANLPNKEDEAETKALPASQATLPAAALALSIKAPPASNTTTVASVAPVKAEEPETEMFEQQTFTTVSAAAPSETAEQNTAMRGTRYKDSFIPPKPIEIDKADYETSMYETAAPQAEAPSQPSVEPLRVQSVPLNEEGEPKSGYTLRPPAVPGAHRVEAEEKRPSQSLFERITGLGSAGLAQVRDLTANREEPAEPIVAAPTQGSLAIDAPAAPPQPTQKEENDLEIPAFLRRQAN